MMAVAPKEDRNTRSMQVQSPLSSQHNPSGASRQVVLSAPSRSRRFSARARIALRGGAGVGIGMVLTAVKRSFNGNSRGRSEVLLQVAQRSPHTAAGVRMEDHRTLVQFIRFAHAEEARACDCPGPDRKGATARA